MFSDQQNGYLNSEITAYLKPEQDFLQRYERQKINDKNSSKISNIDQSQHTCVQRQRQCKYIQEKICSIHNKKIQYICCTCQQLKCVSCQCQVKITGYSNWIDYYGSRHTFVKLSKYFDKRKEELKSMLNIKLNECCIRIQRQRVTKQIQKIHKCLVELNSISSSIKTLITQIIEKCSKSLRDKKVGLRNDSRKRQQEKKGQIEDEKIVQNMLRMRETQKQQIFQEILLENWSCVNRTLRKIKENKNERLFKNRYTNQRSIIQGKNEIRSSPTEFQSVFISKLSKMQSQLQGLRDLMDQQSIGLQNQKRKTNNISRYTQFSVSPSLCKKSIQIYQNEDISNNRNKIKKQYKKIQSITNVLSKQINRPKVAQTTQKMLQYNKICQQQYKLIYIYGGKQTKDVIQIYNPWKTMLQQKKQNLQQKSQQQAYKPTHTGFGLIKIVNLQKNKENKNSKTSSVILVGGYMNSQITDCIFRVNSNCNKRQLIGRLDIPLANFGFYSEKRTLDKRQKFDSIFICGGFDNYKPVSTFLRLQFTHDGSLLSKLDFPSLDRPLHSLTLTKHHENLYAIGGIDQENIVVKTVTKFSFQDLTWKHISNLCYERSNHATISLKSGLYVIGGWNGQNYLRSVQRFDEGKQIFCVIMDMKEARSNFGAIPFIENNGILILGGKNIEQLQSCEYLSIKGRSVKQALNLSFKNSYIYSFL